jgi:hypothetical protein
MANQSRLISGGVNYYIEGGGKYTGSGTPWTVVGTSPYAIAMNDTAGTSYTPMAATRQEVYGGGPPFRNGQTLIYDSYGNVTETVTIQCRANSHDNAVALLQQLRKILNTALFSTPCQLAYQPNGATNAAYFEIYGADVQEDQRFVNSEAVAGASGNALVRAVVTWRRSPFSALISTGETVLSTLTFTNTGTGANNNTQAFSTASGELISEGQPLNISIKPAVVAVTSVRRTYLGSVLSRTYSTTGAGAQSTSSTSANSLVTLATWVVTSKITNTGIKPRVVLRFSTAPTANMLLRLGIFTSSSGYDAYYTPWVSATEPVLGDQHKLVDMGTFPLDAIRRNGVITTPTIHSIVLQGRSTDGLSASLTLGYSEYIWYYDWCRIDTPSFFDTDGTQTLYVDQFPEATGVPCLPWDGGQAFAASGTSEFLTMGDVRGRLPRYFSGASLYVGWVNNSGGHTTTHTATVSARVAPLWATLRGGD